MLCHLGALQTQKETIPARAIGGPLNNTEIKSTNPCTVENLYMILDGYPAGSHPSADLTVVNHVGL